jgi:hypothetical protein
MNKKIVIVNLCCESELDAFENCELLMTPEDSTRSAETHVGTRKH